jgi:hypothetical protein
MIKPPEELWIKAKKRNGEMQATRRRSCNWQLFSAAIFCLHMFNLASQHHAYLLCMHRVGGNWFVNLFLGPVRAR